MRGFSFALASTMSTLISYAFIICHSPQKSSVAQKVYSHSSLDIYCIFLAKFMLYLFCGSSRPSYLGREVYLMIHILTILESVVADVMSHYICKWLDRFDKDRKPD